MAVSKNSNDSGLVYLVFFLAPLVAIGSIIWFFPLAFLLALPCWYFIRNSKVSKALYILVIALMALFAVAYPPTQQFFYDAFETHHRFFSISAFKNGNGFKNMLFYFSNAGFKNIMLYFLFGACLVAVMCFGYGRFLYWLLSRKDPSKRLLKGRKEYKPNFKILEKKFLDLSKRGVPLGVIINYDGKSPLLVPHSILKKHVCLVGTTGSGKTNTLYYFIVNAIYNSKPAIYIDGKGDCANIQRFKTFAKNAKIITMDGTTGYNPFATGTPTELTDKIISMFDWTEEHYKLGASRFIQLLLRYFELTKIDRNLVNIIKYCDLKVIKNHYVSKNAGDLATGLNDLEPDSSGGTSFSLANIGKNAPSVSQTPHTAIFNTGAVKYWKQWKVSTVGL